MNEYIGFISAKSKNIYLTLIMEKNSSKLLHDFLEVNGIEWQILYTSTGAVFAESVKGIEWNLREQSVFAERNINLRE